MNLDRRLFQSLLCSLCLWSCTVDDAGGSGSGTENALHGTFVDERGRAIAGAQVWLLQPGRGPVAAGGADLPFGSPTAKTDASGKYAFKELAAGRYNLQGDYHAGALTVYHPGVDHAALGTEAIDTDTLRAPGAIRGQVATLDGGNPIGALCGILGTSFLALSDSSGGFLLTGVPQGRYSLTYRLPGYVPGKDTGVDVRAGRTTVAPPETLRLDLSAASIAPKGLQAVYDGAQGIVILHWHPWPGLGDGKYRIGVHPGTAARTERVYGDGFRLFEGGGLVKDTTWVDTVIRHTGFDLEAFRETHPDSTPPPYELELTYTVLPEGFESGQPFNPNRSGATLVVKTDRRLWSRRHAYEMLAPGHHAGDTLARGDTLRLVTAFHDSLDGIDTLRWLRGRSNAGLPEALLAERTPASRNFMDTLVVVLDDSMAEGGRISILVKAIGPHIGDYEYETIGLEMPLYFRP